MYIRKQTNKKIAILREESRSEALVFNGEGMFTSSQASLASAGHTIPG